MTLSKTTLWAAALMLGLSACGGDAGNTPAGAPADTLETTDAGSGLVNVGGKLFSIPSPVQTALLVHELGMPYNASLPLGTDSTARMATAQQQALAMGIHGADLAYVTIHKDGQQALKILKSIEATSEALNLTNAFNQTLAERFRKNLGNQDTLLRLSGSAFRAADRYLKEEGRAAVSARILAGGWIESMYLLIGGDSGPVGDKVANRIAGQRRTVGNLVALLELAEGQSALQDSLQSLADAYKEVKYAYTYAEPTLDAANKTTYINSNTKVEVPAGTMETIIRKLKALRALIIA